MPQNRRMPRHTLAYNLRYLLGRDDMSERQLAAKAGIDPKTVNNQVHGRYDPGADKADAVAAVFGLRGWQLLDPDFIEKDAAGASLEVLQRLYAQADDAGRESIMNVAELAARLKKA